MIYFLIARLSLVFIIVYAGYVGIELYFSFWVTILIVILSMVAKFPWPIIVGAFICATDVWGWHWSLALLFAVPGILIIVPAIPVILSSYIKKNERS